MVLYVLILGEMYSYMYMFMGFQRPQNQTCTVITSFQSAVLFLSDFEMHL